MRCTRSLWSLACIVLSSCTGPAPDVAATPATPAPPATPATPATPVGETKLADPPVQVEASGETPEILVPSAERPAANRGEAKPQEVPSTRPRTIEAARLHLLAISADGDISNLAALADAKFGLAFVYRPEGKRARRSKLPLDRTALAAEFGERVPWRPQMYVDALVKEFEPEAVTADAAKLTVAYAPDAAFGIDFIFKKSGEDLVLTQISAWDQEP